MTGTEGPSRRPERTEQLPVVRRLGAKSALTLFFSGIFTGLSVSALMTAAGLGFRMPIYEGAVSLAGALVTGWLAYSYSDDVQDLVTVLADSGGNSDP